MCQGRGPQASVGDGMSVSVGVGCTMELGSLKVRGAVCAGPRFHGLLAAHSLPAAHNGIPNLSSTRSSVSRQHLDQSHSLVRSDLTT